MARSISISGVFLGTGIVAVTLLAGFHLSHADDDASLRAPQVQMRTRGLPKPIILVGDPRQRAVTAFEIYGDFTKEGDGAGAITLDTSTFKFNEFGDAKVVKLETSEPMRVTFKRSTQFERVKKGRVYDVVFADGSFPKRFQLALSDGTAGPHRLAVHNNNQPGHSGDNPITHILDLEGVPKVPELLPDLPQPATLNLVTLSSAHSRNDNELHHVAIHSDRNGTVRLDLDRNYLALTPFGEIVSTTLAEYPPIQAKLRRLDIPDPENQGRQLFEIEANGADLKVKYRLVLAKTEAGPHRLLIRDGDKLAHVLPLYNPDRRYHLGMQAQLNAVSPEEAQAIADLRARVGYFLRFKVESKNVVELSIFATSDSDQVNPALEHLTNLRDVDFGGMRLKAEGLPNLRHLTKLETLRFSGTIDDRGLASLKDLRQLRGLMFYCCRGITDDGMVHFAGLRNLKWLRLYREDSLFKKDPKENLITDAGLVHLARLNELENLDLIGQKITDAGLARLKDLTKIKQLYLSGDGITDAGLQHLHGMSNLNHLHLLETRVTPAGRESLRAKLPNLPPE